MRSVPCALRGLLGGGSAPPIVLLPGAADQGSFAPSREACQDLAPVGRGLTPARGSQAPGLQTSHGATTRADPRTARMMVKEGVRSVERLLAKPNGPRTRKAAFQQLTLGRTRCPLPACGLRCSLLATAAEDHGLLAKNVMALQPQARHHWRALFGRWNAHRHGPRSGYHIKR